MGTGSRYSYRTTTPAGLRPGDEIREPSGDYLPPVATVTGDQWGHEYTVTFADPDVEWPPAVYWRSDKYRVRRQRPGWSAPVPGETLPAKVTFLLERARKLGLEVVEQERDEYQAERGSRRWTIRSAHEQDRLLAGEVWVYYFPSSKWSSRQVGRLSVTEWDSLVGRARRLRRVDVGWALQSMADVTRRRLEREAS